MCVMLEQYHFLKCEEQFFSSNIINSPYRGLKPTIGACERPQTYALDRAATGTGKLLGLQKLINHDIHGSVQSTVSTAILCSVLHVYSVCGYMFRLV